MLVIVVAIVGYATAYVGVANHFLDDLPARILVGAALAGLVGWFPLFVLISSVAVVPPDSE